MSRAAQWRWILALYATMFFLANLTWLQPARALVVFSHEAVVQRGHAPSNKLNPKQVPSSKLNPGLECDETEDDDGISNEDDLAIGRTDRRICLPSASPSKRSHAARPSRAPFCADHLRLPERPPRA